jgi:hypothetical protein
MTPVQITVRRVRAFGELVALLWARGDVAATVRLEFLWRQIWQKQTFSVLRLSESWLYGRPFESVGCNPRHAF